MKWKYDFPMATWEKIRNRKTVILDKNVIFDTIICSLYHIGKYFLNQPILSQCNQFFL